MVTVRISASARYQVFGKGVRVMVVVRVVVVVRVNVT